MKEEKKKNIFVRIWQWIAYEASRAMYVFIWLVFRPKLTRPDGKRFRLKELPKTGALLAANHGSLSDPLVVGSAFLRRRLNFFVAEVVMSKKFRAKLLAAAGAIKVNRDIADIEAVRNAVEVLKKGRLLLIFPEGGVQEAGKVQSLKSGTALMSLQAGTPVLPLFLCPGGRWYNRHKIIVGDLIDPKALCSRKIPSTADIQKITDALQEEMQRISQNYVPSEKENET